MEISTVCVCVGGGVCLWVLFCCRQLAAQVFVGGSSRRGSLAAAAVFDALPHFKLELKVCCCYCSMRWLTTQHARFPFPPYPLRVRSSLCLCFFASALFMQNCLRLRPLSLSPSRWLSQSLGWPNTHTRTHKSLTGCRHSGAPTQVEGRVCGAALGFLYEWSLFACSSRSKLFSELHFNLTQLFIYLLPAECGNYANSSRALTLSLSARYEQHVV